MPNINLRGRIKESNEDEDHYRCCNRRNRCNALRSVGCGQRSSAVMTWRTVGYWVLIGVIVISLIGAFYFAAQVFSGFTAPS
jgi:hypothetical protein